MLKYIIVIENLVMYIISPLGETVMKIKRCPSTHMYYADLSIPPLLLTSTTPKVPHTTNSLPIVATVHGARKLGPLNKITIAKVMWLHSRMNHPSRSVMAGALRNNAWIGIDDLAASDIERVLGKIDCIFCSQTKLNRLPVNLGSGIRPPGVGHTVSVDFKPCAPKGVGGYIGFYLFSCCLTLYLHVFLVKTHNATGLTAATEQVQLFYARHGHTVKILRSDAGKVETSAEYRGSLARMKIHSEEALPEQQYQNSVERSVQTLVKGVSCMMLAQNFLPSVFWPFAVLDWTHTRNHTPNSLTDTVALVTLVTKYVPDLSKRFKFKFGSPVTSTVLNRAGQVARDGTFTPRNEFGITIGSTSGLNGGSLLHIPSRGGTGARAYHRGDVHLLKMDDQTEAQRLQLKVRLLQQEQVYDVSNDAPAHFESQGEESWVARYHRSLAKDNLTSTQTTDSHDTYSIALDSMSSTIPNYIPPITLTPNTIDTNIAEPAIVAPITSPPIDNTPTPIEGLTSIDDTPGVDTSLHTTNSSPVDLPPTHPEEWRPRWAAWADEWSGPSTCTMSMRDRARVNTAALGKQWTSRMDKLWDHRIERELDAWERINDAEVARNKQGWFGTSVIKAKYTMPSCIKNKKCHTASSPPRKTNKKQVSISLKQAQASPDWPSYEASIEKEKATLTALNTGELVDPASVTGRILPTRYIFKIKRDGTFKCRLVVLGNLEIKRESMFSPTANDKSLRLLLALSINLNMTLKGYDIFGAFCNPILPRTVYIRLPDGSIWRLNKALYGLRDSPKLFYEDVSALLLSAGYSRCENDPCMFHKTDSRGSLIAVVHVDDFAVASTSEEMHEELKDTLLSKYTITSNDLNDFLGFNISYNKDGSMTLTMPKLLKATIDEFLSDSVPRPTSPMSDSFNEHDQDNSPMSDATSFTSLLGKLIYLVKCRPDVAYAVARLSCRPAKCTQKDWNALLRVLAYLRETVDFGITFSKNGTDINFLSTIFVYADAAYNTHTDSKSHTGYCVSLGGPANGMFYFRSFKQTNVSLSSTEAEVNAAVEATKEIVWLRALLAELGLTQLEPTVLYADNKSMITLCTEYSGNHKRVKHYLNRINFMLENVKTGVIKLEYMPTTEHKADGLTKALTGAPFTRAAADLLGNSV